MAQPKRKMSKSKTRSRKMSKTGQLLVAVPCKECGAPRLPHRVCPSCGTYKGRQVITVDAGE